MFFDLAQRRRNLARYGDPDPGVLGIVRTWYAEDVARYGPVVTAAAWEAVRVARAARRAARPWSRVKRVVKAAAIGAALGTPLRWWAPWWGQLSAGIGASIIPRTPTSVGFTVGLAAMSPIAGVGSLIVPVVRGKKAIKPAVAAGLGGWGLSRYVRGGALAGIGLGLAGGMYLGYKLFGRKD